MSRLLGIDLGERRIGLAVGDEATGIARGLGTIARGSLDRDATTIGRLASEHGAAGLVIGLPLRLDGAEGPQAAATRAWGTALGARLGLAVFWRDERLTSVAAEEELGRPPRGRSGGPPSRAALGRRRAAIDREAARLILQAELDDRARVTR